MKLKRDFTSQIAKYAEEDYVKSKLRALKVVERQHDHLGVKSVIHVYDLLFNPSLND